MKIFATILAVMAIAVLLPMMSISIGNMYTLSHDWTTQELINQLTGEGYLAYSDIDGNWTVTGDATVEGDLYAEGLTATRVPFIGADGLFTDDGDLTFTAGTTLNATTIAATTVGATTLNAPTGRTATYVIAASDATVTEKAQADYVCTGTHDEVTIQAGIDAVYAAGGGTVYLTEGLFSVSKVTGQEHTAMILVKTGVELVGSGYGTHIKVPNGFNTDCSIVGSSDRVTIPEVSWDYTRIANIRFDGNRANQGGGVMQGYKSYHSYYCVIENCYFENFTYPGINPFYCGKYQIINNTCVNNRLTSQIYVDALIDSIVSGNIIKDSISPGILMDESRNTVVSNNYLVDCGTSTSAIEVRGNTLNCVVSGNVIDGCKRGILIYSTYGSSPTGDRYNTISGNNIYNATDNGIEIEWQVAFPSGYNTISGNTIETIGKHGIDIKSSNNLISGNFIAEVSQTAGNTYDCIYLEGSYANYNLITDNVCRRGALANKARYGINVSAATCTGNTIKNNDLVSSGTTSAFIDSGTNTQCYTVICDHFQDVQQPQDNGYVNNKSLSTGLPITMTPNSDQPDVARNVSWNFDSHAQITAFTIVIIGVDGQGRSKTVTITELDGWTGVTAVAFATFTSIQMTSRTGTGVADTMDIGQGSVFGLANPISAGDVFKVKKNNFNWPAASYTVNTTYNTVDPSTGGGISGGDDFTIWYKVNLNTLK